MVGKEKENKKREKGIGFKRVVRNIKFAEGLKNVLSNLCKLPLPSTLHLHLIYIKILHLTNFNFTFYLHFIYNV